jgi:methyl-accepting chemotaxis protein
LQGVLPCAPGPVAAAILLRRDLLPSSRSPEELAQMHDPLADVLLALTIVLGVGVLILLAMLIGLAVAGLKVRKKVNGLIRQYETQVAPQVGPMAQRARELVDDLSPKIKDLVSDLSPKIKDLVNDLSPKIKHIASNVSDISDTLRNETQHITGSVNDVVDRTHQQAERVDHMITSTLSGIGHATSAVQQGIAVPIRHLSGVMEGLRAGLGSLFRKDKHHNGHRTDFTAPDVSAKPQETTAIVETATITETTALARPADVEPLSLTESARR